MEKYKTKPIDFEGCHPVIAEHLRRGEAILCRVPGGKTMERLMKSAPLWRANDRIKLRQAHDAAERSN